MVFDRWTMLKHAFEKHGISGCRVLVKDVNTVIPNDFKEFKIPEGIYLTSLNYDTGLKPSLGEKNTIIDP